MPGFLKATLTVAKAQALLVRPQPVSITEVKAPDFRVPRLYRVRAVILNAAQPTRKSSTRSRRKRWIRAFEQRRSKNTIVSLFLACRTLPPWVAYLQPIASNQDVCSDMLLS